MIQRAPRARAAARSAASHAMYAPSAATCPEGNQGMWLSPVSPSGASGKSVLVSMDTKCTSA